jgi:hypothetical protein
VVDRFISPIFVMRWPARFKKVAVLTRFVRDDAESDPPVHSVEAMVTTAIEPVSSLSIRHQYADAVFRADTPSLPSTKPALAFGRARETSGHDEAARLGGRRDPQLPVRQLRSELARSPKRRTRKANARFGWLGRHTVQARVSGPVINYEPRGLFSFFRWAIKQNHLFVNPTGTTRNSACRNDRCLDS